MATIVELCKWLRRLIAIVTVDCDSGTLRKFSGFRVSVGQVKIFVYMYFESVNCDSVALAKRQYQASEDDFRMTYSRGLPRPPEASRDLPRPPEISRDLPRSPEAFPSPPEASRGLPSPPEASRGLPRSPETSRGTRLKKPLSLLILNTK